jgi:hypothetical protein
MEELGATETVPLSCPPSPYPDPNWKRPLGPPLAPSTTILSDETPAGTSNIWVAVMFTPPGVWEEKVAVHVPPLSTTVPVRPGAGQPAALAVP